jgi:two-component system response regulator YesN
VTGNISPEELREKADFLDMPFAAEACLCAVVAVSPQASGSLREQLSENEIEDMARAVPGARTIAFYDSEGNLVLLMALDSALGDRRGIQAALEGIVASHESALTIGVGQPVKRLEEAHVSYEGACKCLEYGMFKQGSGVIWFDGVPEIPSPGLTLERVDFDKLEGLIRRGDLAATQDYLDEALSTVVKDNPLTPKQAHNLLMHIAVRMTDCFHRIYGSMNTYREPTEFDFAGLFRLRHYSDMRLWLHALCERLFSDNAAVLGKSSSLVGLAVDYIARHYREGVTLKQVAADCCINTSYLGQIFRKEMGCAFTDYVNGLRIREAQRLLTNPTLKVYEVAEQVGYTDYHYFLKIFKKVTGTTPRDMRN